MRCVYVEIFEGGKPTVVANLHVRDVCQPVVGLWHIKSVIKPVLKKVGWEIPSYSPLMHVSDL